MHVERAIWRESEDDPNACSLGLTAARASSLHGHVRGWRATVHPAGNRIVLCAVPLASRALSRLSITVTDGLAELIPPVHASLPTRLVRQPARLSTGSAATSASASQSPSNSPSTDALEHRGMPHGRRGCGGRDDDGTAVTPLSPFGSSDTGSFSQISLECTRHRRVPRPRTLSSPSIPFAIAGDKFRA